jgi:enoyl-CoA hydratase/carnithine racemase
VTELVRVDREGAVAVVTVDNPPVNALADSVIEALDAAAAALAGDEAVRAVVLTGAGEKAFLAGADLDEFAERLSLGEGIDAHVAATRRALRRWESLPQPVVAAVQAHAMGGGLEVALVCDFVVADPAARFGTPEIRLGLMPGAGATQRLPRRIGAAAAKAMIMLGTTVDAAEAQRLGLVHSVSPPGEALAAGRALAEELASLPAVAVRAVKRALSEGLADGLDRERELFLEVFGSADAREGVEAFRARRSPRFGHA